MYNYVFLLNSLPQFTGYTTDQALYTASSLTFPTAFFEQQQQQIFAASIAQILFYA